MKKKVLAGALSIVLSLAMCMTTMAATWNDVNTWEKLSTAFADADPDVIIHLTGDIEWESELETGVGQTYTINGKEYVMTKVYLDGEGKVEINSQVDEISAAEKVNITVNNDVKGQLGAAEESAVTVNGNAEYVVAEGDSSVTVNGNVTGISGDPDEVDYDDPEDYSDGSDGVYATDDAVVNVTGDVKGGDAYGTYGYAGDGVYAEDNAQVAVGGNVTGGSVTAKPEVTVSENCESMAGDGVAGESTATVTVGGNVTGGNTNADAGYAGKGIYIYLVQKDGQDGLRAATPQESTAGKIYVEGSVTGGDATAANGTDGEGISLYRQPGYDYVSPYYFNNNEELAEFIANGAFDVFEDIFENEITISDDEYENLMDAYKQAVMDAYEADMGQDFPTTVEPKEAIQAALEGKNSSEDWEKLGFALTECVNETTDAMYAKDTKIDDVFIPEITVFSVEGGGDAEKIATNVEGALEDVFKDAYLNYIVRVLQAEHGTVSVDKELAKEGETITITAKPDQGYKIGKVMVSGKEVVAKDGVYTYTVPEGGAVEVSALFVSTSIPQTGDAQPVVLWGMMLMVAAASALVAWKKSKA